MRRSRDYEQGVTPTHCARDRPSYVSPIDEVDQRLPFCRFQVNAPDRHGDHVGSRPPVRFRHHLMTRVFSGAHDQARIEGPASNHEGIAAARTTPDKMDDFEFIALRDSDAPAAAMSRYGRIRSAVNRIAISCTEAPWAAR